MPDKPVSSIAAGVAKLATEEASFRKRVWEFLPALLRSDAPSSLKALTLVISALFVLMSLEFSTMLAEVLFALAQHAPMSFAFYRYSFVGESGLTVFVGFPLVLRMDSVQQAKRLEDEFVEIEKVKRNRRPTRSH